jgi:hypothetical protein
LRELGVGPSIAARDQMQRAHEMASPEKEGGA